MAPGATPLVIPNPVSCPIRSARSPSRWNRRWSIFRLPTSPSRRPRTRSAVTAAGMQPQQQTTIRATTTACTISSTASSGQPLRRRTRDAAARKGYALGSGVVVDKAGYILTNNHVVDKADRIQVKFAGDPDRIRRQSGRRRRRHRPRRDPRGRQEATSCPPRSAIPTPCRWAIGPSPSALRSASRPR